jgi:hypothetical protein
VPAPSAEAAWWARVKRAAERRGDAGKLMSDWSHDMIEVLAAAEGRMELVGPFGHRTRQPMPLERCTEEYKQAETRRLTDRLGRRLGVGPMPRVKDADA